MTTRLFALAGLMVAWGAACTPTPEPEAGRPNVILIITDDQGYGDLGATGNPVIRTPHLDAMARRSAQMTTFYVSPVCAPTRASLMTGRYNYRTRAIDTFHLMRALSAADCSTASKVSSSSAHRTSKSQTAIPRLVSSAVKIFSSSLSRYSIP